MFFVHVLVCGCLWSAQDEARKRDDLEAARRELEEKVRGRYLSMEFRDM